MKRVVVDHFGGPDVLRVVPVEVPPRCRTHGSSFAATPNATKPPLAYEA
jgi:hypothetical protein